MQDYTIVSNVSERFLADGIRELIKRGWQPTGGISIKHESPEVTTFYQAMVLPDQVKEPKIKKQEVA